METFWVEGVVKNGQVVLEASLDVPDGTVVTVEYELPPTTEQKRLTTEEFLELTSFLAANRDNKEWPAFEAQLKLKYGNP